jgi:hypothetical protein
VASRLVHLQDILAEGILLAPVLKTVFSLILSFPSVDDEQYDEGCDHTSEDANPDNDIHPLG